MKKILIILMLVNFQASAQFIKISKQGEVLASDANRWSCVLDDETRLIWQVKSPFGDAKSTYTWFDGNSGVKNNIYSKNCTTKKQCNTQNYIQQLNKKTLCDRADWRLPSVAELSGLLIFADEEPLIDTRFFPNTQPAPYWTSNSSPNNPDIAIDIPFFYGGTRGSDKSFDSHIRAVTYAK